MRIGLDARSLTMPRPRGTGRNLLDAYRLIPTLRPDWEFILYHQRPAPVDDTEFEPLWRHQNVRLRRIDLPGDRFDLWLNLWLPLAAWRDHVDLLHLPANRAPAWCPVPLVVTIHDLAPLRVPDEQTPAATAAFRRGVRHALRLARQIITVSHATGAELHREFGLPPQRLNVIPWAADTRIAAAVAAGLSPGELARLRERYCLGERWLVTFAGSHRRKNARGTLAGFARVTAAQRCNVQLVLIGCEPQEYRHSLAVDAERLGIAAQCRILGFVPHGDLPGLLAGSCGLLMPSRHEGFGLPILDAFVCGVPVLTSNLTSMPEVAGDAAVYCDPNDLDSIAHGIATLLEPATAKQLVAKGRRRLEQFSWQRTAEAMCAVYERAAARPGARVSSPTSSGRQNTLRAAAALDPPPELARFQHGLNCRHYRGDRPCAVGIQGVCPPGCARYVGLGQRILIIKLAALGDVIRTAALLPGLKEVWPHSQITWITRPAGVRALANHPLIDRLLPLDADTLAHITSEHFDLCLSLDKEPAPAGLAMTIQAADKRGIGLSPAGTPRPLNPECAYYFELGLNDDLKFRRNQKSYPQLIYEAVGLTYRGQRYRLYPDERQRAAAASVWRRLGVRPPEIVVGLNTGAGRVFANKNWPPDRFLALARHLVRRAGWRVALLGGPQERSLNRDLATACPGLLDTGCDHDELTFAAIVSRCQVLVTGDTLALHVALAADVPCVVLFGPTCAQEIDLFGCGEKLVTRLSCAPCYRRQCNKSPNCMDDIDVDRVLAAVERWARRPQPRPVPLPLVEVEA